MQKSAGRFMVAIAVVGLSLLGCNLPTVTATPGAAGTSVDATLAALETSAALAITQTAPARLQTATPLAAVPTGTAVDQRPLVTTDALCWVGPGNQFEVVSAIRNGTRVDLLGRGTIAGWYIVRNPIYHDPCWILATALQIDPSVNIAGLPYFSPPPTPTPTPTQTPTITNTPAPSPTPTSTP